MSVQRVRLEEEEEGRRFASQAATGHWGRGRETKCPTERNRSSTTLLFISTRKEKEPIGHPEARKVSSVITVCFEDLLAIPANMCKST